MLQLNRGFAIEYEGSMFHNAITILHVTFITYYYFTMPLLNFIGFPIRCRLNNRLVPVFES